MHHACRQMISEAPAPQPLLSGTNRRHLERQLPIRAPAPGAGLAGRQPRRCPGPAGLKAVDQVPARRLRAAGYHAVCFGQKTYNGVAIVSRTPARDVVRNIPVWRRAGACHRHHAGYRRWPAAPGQLLLCHGQAPGTDKFAYKRWLAALQDWLRDETAAHPRLALVGDFNIAPEDRDSYDPVGLKDTIHHTVEERAFPAAAGRTWA